ncbi:MAG: acetyl-CoA carboxylase, biotin carboxyl carrier protein [Oscillospiraceae bacterium]|nr:acetyl-CoA carboxylase, biotin carboxyl carrier protein [Oscillospiraceae bacterium]
MESKDIRELALIMREMGLSVLDYSGKGESIRLERSAAGSPAVATSAPATFAETTVEHRTSPAAKELVAVNSPTVGTFYAASEPDKAPFVAVGDAVRSGDVLCLLEAMKMLNEITAPCDGVIAEICAEDKQVVEYGQALFTIDTAAV